MALAQQVRDRREAILKLASARGARNVRLFGSAARGDDDVASDIDFLVEMDPGRSLLDVGGLVMDLQQLLQCRVDVVTENGLRERIKARVLREAVPL